MNKHFSDKQTSRVFNFYPGPSTLPIEVLNQISENLYNWKNLGLNPMEIGHRTNHFIELYQDNIKKIKSILSISDEYEILFMHAGAIGQYAAIPLNLMANHNKATYILCGHWSEKASKEFIQIYGKDKIEIGANAQDFQYKKLPEFDAWQYSKDSAYLYYTANETINGLCYTQDVNSHLNNIQIKQLPPLVCDYTSSLLTQEMEVSRYGLIFASTQKTLGIAGATLVIIRKDLLRKSNQSTPSVFDYTKASEKESMLNTPSTFSWYVMNLILDWVVDKGGVKALALESIKKANLIYDCIDGSDFYHNAVDKKYRSLTNICFNIANKDLELVFAKEAEKAGLVGLKGHREVGGIRASIYNAMPIEGALVLKNFMNDFEKNYG